MENNLMIQSDVYEDGTQYWFIWDCKNNDFVGSSGLFPSFDSYYKAKDFLDKLQAAK